MIAFVLAVLMMVFGRELEVLAPFAVTLVLAFPVAAIAVEWKSRQRARQKKGSKP